MANGIHGSTEAKQPKLFCWSARDEKGITRLCESYARYFSSIESHRTSTDDDKNLTDDLWYTLTHRRSTLDWKSWCLASTIDELQETMTKGISRPIRSSKIPQLAFVFTGQGAQWHAMGRELMAYKVYRESIQQANDFLASTGCLWSVIGIGLPSVFSGGLADSNPDQMSSIATQALQSSMRPSTASLYALSSRSLSYNS